MLVNFFYFLPLYHVVVEKFIILHFIDVEGNFLELILFYFFLYTWFT